MLGKLMKQEFKQTAHSVLTVYCAALGAMAFMLLSYVTKVTWLGILGSVALIIIGGLAVAMTLVMVIQNFQRSLYGNQGYLTFTLPVNCSKLLFSKSLVSGIWILISYLALMACFVIVYFYAKIKAQGFGDGLMDMFSGFEIISQLPSKLLIFEFLACVAIYVLLYVLTFIGFAFFSITLANTRPLQKHPLAFGLLIFMAIYIVTQIISTKLMYSFPLSVVVRTESIGIEFVAMSEAFSEGIILPLGIAGVLFNAIAALGMLLLTGWIMENKVSIK